MIDLLDRFYTPSHVATRLADTLPDKTLSCIDTSCGEGALLVAAEKRFPRLRCTGLDVDDGVISRMRRLKPNWLLSVCDLLSPRSRAQSQVVLRQVRRDVLICNPPFSMDHKKGIWSEFLQAKCSVAMAHLIASVELFKPRQAIVTIVPESLLHSDLDRKARGWFEAGWAVHQLLTLHNTTFEGGRANASLVLMLPSQGPAKPNSTPAAVTYDNLECRIVRGGLPVHEAKTCVDGTRFIHTTDLSAFGATPLKTVKPIDRGRVVGDMVLLPRVGVPSLDSLRRITQDTSAQLSDCVIALCCKNRSQARDVERRLREEYSSLCGLYRGTGARYITVARVQTWLSTIGISVVD